MKSLFPLHLAIIGCAWLPCLQSLAGAVSSPSDKPVLLYSRYFNAIGESRYLPDGTYQDVLDRLRNEFEVLVNSEPLTAKNLAGVNCVLIANPSETAVGNNPTPHHLSRQDIEALARFVNAGGGVIIMGNQENHNLEIENTNKLLARFGIQFTNAYTDVKALTLPAESPVIGGLRWAYYTGNLLLLDRQHTAKPRALVQNDLSVKPLAGTRDQAGVLMAAAEPGRGRVVAVTDAGWISNDALSGKGLGGVAIQAQDNWEIFRRLARSAASGKPPGDRQK
jgi:hypothetical protein